MTTKKIIIAIDGFSSTGKSTLAKALAKTLGYVHVDSGAMYRAVAYFAMQKDVINTTHFDKKALIAALDNIQIHFEWQPESQTSHVYLNGVDVESEIRTMNVSNFVSRIAAIPEVRQKLVEQQRKMGANKGLVMDGRDIGTVVFPNAEIKLFMTASPQKRAQRRYTELTERGEATSYETVLENIKTRDHIDATREDSPLKKALNGIIIDNTNLSLEQQFETILDLVMKTLNDL